MTERSSFGKPIAAVMLGILAGAVVPLRASFQKQNGDLAAHSEKSAGPVPKRVRVKGHEPQRGAGNPQQELAESYAQRRASFLTLWGRPPIPTEPSELPTERDVRILLDRVGAGVNWEVKVVECFTYPCVATMFSPECPGESVVDAVRESYPSAYISSNQTGTRVDGVMLRGCSTTVAFLDQSVPIPSPEWRFIYRLTSAVEHRARQSNFDDLHAWAIADRGAVDQGDESR